MTQTGRWWKCDCGKTIGEIVGDRVIVKVGGRTIIAAAQGAEQTCSCGRHVVLSYTQDKLAA